MEETSSSATQPRAAPDSDADGERIDTVLATTGATSAVESTRAPPNLRSNAVLNVHVPLRECLLPWFDVFGRSSTKWGLVSDVRSDGTTYKRHGIIVELSADISRAIGAIDTALDYEMRRLRQAIDLVKLALAVNPHAIIPLMLRRSPDGEADSCDDEHGTELDEGDLETLTRGDAPFELRICFKIHTEKNSSLGWSLVRMGMRKLDKENVQRSRTSPSQLRDYLVNQAQAKPSSARLVSLPIPTTIHLKPMAWPSENGTMNEQRCWNFFITWGAMTQSIHHYQERRVKDWKMDKNIAPFVVTAMEFHLRDVPLTKTVFRALRETMAQGISISASSVTLDYRHVRCEEDKLDFFFDAITRHKSNPLKIYTGSDSDASGDERAGGDSTTISMILRCIGRLRHDIEIDIGPMLVDCTTKTAQEAVIQGLLASVTTRDFATRLSVSDCEVNNVVVDDLTRLVRRHTRTMRDAHPLQKRRLQSIEWSLRAEGGTTFLRAFLRALDDVEEIKLEVYDEDYNDREIKMMLRYPSLRSLHIERPAITTMDIFHKSSKLPQMPALKRLVLDGLTLDDEASMIRFIKRLDPGRKKPTVMSTSLHELSIAESDISIAPNEDREGVHHAINASGARKTLRRVLATNRVLQHVNFLGDLLYIPVRLATAPFKQRPALKGHVPAPDAGQSGLSRARHAAFLSVIHGGVVTACQALDSNVISMIFDFAAPHARRCIRI